MARSRSNGPLASPRGAENSAGANTGTRTVIPFNRPFLTGREHDYIYEAAAALHLASGGGFSRRCEQWLARETGATRVFLTHSGTAALELAALLCNIGPGDEVVMPSFTFVSTANAFALRGATPVFVDIRPDTLNLDPNALEDSVTSRTKAIVPVHYAGIACEMDEILAFCRPRGIVVIEDAAHGLLARYRGRPLGSLGALSALSFHETKNISCGEGGALLLNDPALVDRAEVLAEKGTDRRRFFRGEVDKYTWVDLGSSFLASDVACAFLYAQLEAAHEITEQRRRIWSRYHDAFAELEQEGRVRRPWVPSGCEHNAHIYYLLLADEAARDAFMQAMNARGVRCVFHYQPLHVSPAGRRYGRAAGALAVTEQVSSRLVRLPLWAGMTADQADTVITAACEVLRPMASRALVSDMRERRPPVRSNPGEANDPGAPGSLQPRDPGEHPRPPIAAKRVAIVQSSYIPWKGYFDLIHSVDEFVLYDDAQFTVRDWRSRNRIKTPSGLRWLSIPIQVKGRRTQTVREAVVADPNWGTRHWQTFANSYRKAPYFRTVRDAFEELFRKPPSASLSEINRAFITRICELLGVSTPLVCSTIYSKGGDATQKLADICVQAGATVYVSGPAARAYLDESRFTEHGIRVEYFDYSGYPVYEQLYPPFVHEVSILDLLAHTGDAAPAYMKTFARPHLHGEQAL